MAQESNRKLEGMMSNVIRRPKFNNLGVCIGEEVIIKPSLRQGVKSEPFLPVTSGFRDEEAEHRFSGLSESDFFPDLGDHH